VSAPPETTTVMEGQSAVEISHHFADLPECRLHYVRRGEGKPVLFLHGFPQFWFLWRHQLAGLGADHAVYAADMRGYNLSCKPKEVEAYRMRHLLADLCGLVEHLDLAPLTLVGHDWGGIASWALALKYPDLLERLVIIDAPPPFTWNRDLRQSPKQRDAVNYMVEFSKPSPGPEEMLSANDFSLMDDYHGAARMGEQGRWCPGGVGAKDHLAVRERPYVGDLGRARRRPAPIAHPRPERINSLIREFVDA